MILQVSVDLRSPEYDYSGLHLPGRCYCTKGPYVNYVRGGGGAEKCGVSKLTPPQKNYI